MRVISPKTLDAPFQELKEAVCDAILNLTTDRVSGNGEAGTFVFGRSPKRAFVAGLLLPRFDEQGIEDETSDIRISTLGIDLHISSNATGCAELHPSFSTYVRVLPTWEELQDPRYGLDVEFELDPAVEQAIRDAIRTRRRAKFADEGLNRPDPKDMPLDERRKRQMRRAEIRRQVTREAYAVHNIELTDEDTAESSATADTAPAATLGSPLSLAAAPETRADEADPGANTDPSASDDTVPTVRIPTLLRRGRRVPHALLRPGEIPHKWRRLRPELPTFIWDLSLTGSDLAAEAQRYSATLQAAATQYVRTWLTGPEGMEQAARDVPVSPADIESREAWEAFLGRARAAPPQIDRLMPAFDHVRIGVDRLPDFSDPSVTSLRVTLENDNPEFSSRVSRQRVDTLFQAGLTLSLPGAQHRFLKLDRVEPSYRFRDHMLYPAMGLNCGVTNQSSGGNVMLATTWAPRFVQPRIVPPTIPGIPYTFAVLADAAQPCSALQVLPDAYRQWITDREPVLRQEVRTGVASIEEADAETRRLEQDLAGQRKEARYIERGVQLLMMSQKAAQSLQVDPKNAKRDQLEREAMPWRAWLLMNRSFLNREKGAANRGWRLFQLAFVLAHIPTLVSRIPEFKTWHDPELDEASASLLYFPTGGGKSEAFYGTLIFALFLDRLRGKNRGITAMIRYPLRLLTLQQAQRLLKLLVHAELVRKKENIGTWPFEIGFWVGKTNTPNRFSEVSGKIPADNDANHPDDKALMPVPTSGNDELIEQARTYEESLLAYNKIPNCPVCGQPTGLRRVLSEGDTARRLAIVCFNATCQWNSEHAGRAPLPFVLTDDAIYQRAPSIVLGTVDKMAMLGQNTDTISQLLGMFGLARWVGPTGHLWSPRGERLQQDPTASGYRTVFPAYRSGDRLFHDPFPSLIIQDEAHLLEESLGTFSGLFETLFELTMARISDIAGEELEIARCWQNGQWGPPRTPKIIAATATVSDPERQLEVLYQRAPLRFPYPGPDIYRSFFAEPAQVPSSNRDRLALARSLVASQQPEATAPWMRLYVSLMTNGATHTMTAVTVLSAFHLVITDLWRRLNDPGRRASGIALLRSAIMPGRAGDWRRRALDSAVAAGQENVVLALVDLHRIGLTYVTNKKGGDQIMDALDLQVKRDHSATGYNLAAFDCRLISGGIDMRAIQQIMNDAEREFPDGSDYPDIISQMRSVVATSAISHGVDVDRFNSMFFAGLPSDVAEYIQASSRVGRTHVGFVMLIPTPQSRRDRYVVETHDIFHRFLERMIAPPAAQRWAANAIKRVTASMIQAWAMLKEAERFKLAPDAAKDAVPQYDIMRPLNTLATTDRLAMRDELGRFMLRGIGFPGRGTLGIGRPAYADVYRDLVDRGMKDFVDNVATFNSQIKIAEFWTQNSGVQPPMTSLRDVDEAGFIVPSVFDPHGAGGTRRVSQEAFVDVMKAIRSQRGSAAETDREGENPAKEPAA
jgi:hypothetical protein